MAGMSGPYYKWNGGEHSPMKTGSLIAVLFSNHPVPLIKYSEETRWQDVLEFCIIEGETNDGTMLQLAENQYEMQSA